MFDFAIPKLSHLLDEADFRLLTSHGQRRLYRDQQLIYDRGDNESHLNVVITGGVSIYRIRSDGAIAVTIRVGSGQHFGDVTALCRLPQTHRAVAVGPTEIQHYSREAFDRILDDYPRITRALYQVAAYEVVTTLEVYDDIRLLPIPVRLGKMLLRMVRSANCNEIPCTQDGLAQMLGVSLGSIIHALKVLADEALIETRYRRIVVPGIPALEAWVARHDWD